MLAAQLTRLQQWRHAVTRVRDGYARVHGRAPSLLRPARFSEKMQWRKLFDLNPHFAVLCDKLASRAFVAGCVGDAHLPPLLWSGQPDAIPFDDLVPPWVLKSTHGSGQTVMVGQGELVDRAALRACAADWLGYCHGTRHDEPGYVPVPRRLLIERAVQTEQGERPEEVRMFLFDGRVAAINTVFVEDGHIRNGAFHTPGWRRLDWHFSRVVDRPFPPPRRLAEMITMAERLGRGLDHVRVDFYDGGDRFWVGELTLYSWSGHARFRPDEADAILGAAWRLPAPALRAGAAVLLRRRPAQ